MKHLREYVNENLLIESISKLNPDKEFPHWMIYNFDYKLVYDILSNNFNEVQKIYNQNKNYKGYDFKCLKENDSSSQNQTKSYLGIIYKTIDRKNKKIDFDVRDLKPNNKLNIPKNNLINNTYIAYIFNDKLCLVKKEEIESNIDQFRINDINQLNISYEYELSAQQKELYETIYNIYDNINPDLKFDFNKIKKLQEFRDIQTIIDNM